MSTPRRLNLLERIANNVGVVYRYHARQFPRRWAILKEVMAKELAPPKPNEWPVIKRDFINATNAMKAGIYKNFTVREALVYAAIGMEIIFWFFLGEIIGRRHFCGYLVPHTYISKKTRKEAKHYKAPDKHAL